ncbi:MAG: NrfD/PsrC family molybdoenzyme membrane anchor subunit [Rhodocyclaceae bacterium]|nr:NrfD/PsrC family molybdoenzyme membrane anchor subunit [Rhodocyclaceae bacterium]MDZ4215144.1 NrfD/PsrC family molybdoenzyme membrane anchor subunit [Rhodocyclaceae bacterium]
MAAPSGLVNTVFLAGIAGAVISVVLVLASLMGEGHASFNTTSDGVVWGLPISNYLFFVIMSTGLTFVAAFGMVFGIKEFYPVAKRCVWLALATLLAGFASLAFELGHPFRMLWALPTSFQIYSPMNWMGVLYGAELVFIVWKMQKLNAGDWDSGVSKKLGMASFVAAILAVAMLGSVFGMMAMRPYWFGGMIPMYFLLSALLCGVALTVLISYIAYGFERNSMPPAMQDLFKGTTSTLYASIPVVFGTVIGITLVALTLRTATGLWSHQDGFQAFNWMVASPWFTIEAIALLAAFVMMMNPGMRAGQGAQIGAAVLVLVAMFIDRYLFVIGGQVVPVFKGAWVSGFVDYTPSLTEWMLVVMSISLCLAIYAFGEKKLRLTDAPSS